ncbi:MAG: transcriptional regulator [Acidobacteria bacterium]|nr:transcriptional regulator [Acidobacteriota bacterium]
MFRKELLELLRARPMTVTEIARLAEQPIARVRDDLQHLERTLRRAGGRLEIEPARCRSCGFVFSADKLTRPGHCPRCRGSWISEPVIGVRQTSD